MGESVAVLGAAGYAGAVASALLHRHPHFELTHVTARSDAGERLDAVHPRSRVPLVLEQYDRDRHAAVDAAVVAYPHGAAAPVVAELRERGVRVVDLSADFRLRSRAVYEEWYGDHAAPGLIGDAVYGLPELHRDAIAGADLVANPGCYPTAAILALAPLARAGLLGDVVIDAKSGVSGAGREPTASKHFVAVDETVTPYKVGRHRHTPEIEQELGDGVRVTFTPHLVPLAYGELVSCYVTPTRDEDFAALYARAYDDEPWVEVVAGPPGMQEVRETNYCRISLHGDERTGRLIVFATIDNLWKGTSSQAVQNLNLMFGRDEGEGL
ncbi:MAG TPA: N-acetyl-gamma-glutamyl-phosphate reductase [Solirubrobacteraceae bacterium]|nr:N-acetyl-gamma-glutamyl-phosphate reductase [Solirubrobacteraceae bacterium]